MDENAVFEFKPSYDPEKIISIPVVQELAKSIHDDDGSELLQRYIRDPDQVKNPSANATAYTASSDAALLPIIDMEHILSQENMDARLQEMKKLHEACQEWGFFQVINHGVPYDYIEKTRAKCREFFHLPLKEKMKFRQVKGLEGYGQLNVAHEDQRLDWGDLLFLETFPLHIRQKEQWPQNPHDFSETLIDFVTSTEKLAATMMRLSEENLGVESGTFTEYCKTWNGTTRLNYYPPCPKPDQVLAQSPHCDTTCFTVLLQDEKIPGLQIRKDGHDQWISVPPIPDALVVILGDFMELITNGKYKSVEHRVIPNEKHERISVVAFYYPEPEAGPAPELVDPMVSTIYKKINCIDYFKIVTSKPLQGKQFFSDYLTSNNK